MKAFFILVAILVVLSSEVLGQRPPYAGVSLIGYGEVADRFTTSPKPGDIVIPSVGLPKNPWEDPVLLDRISKFPVDVQPFWYLNWKLLEALKNQEVMPTGDVRP